jgi:predicted nucleic acid-binding protein
MPGDPFLDTNILVYAFSTTEPGKCHRARSLLQMSGVCISTQNLNELSSVMIHKFQQPYSSVAAAIRHITDTTSLYQINLNDIQRAISLSERYTYGFYDSLILSAALANQCSTLYTENMQHGQTIDGALTIINPFDGSG